MARFIKTGYRFTGNFTREQILELLEQDLRESALKQFGAQLDGEVLTWFDWDSGGLGAGMHVQGTDGDPLVQVDPGGKG